MQYTTQRKGGREFERPQDVDLWLDLLDEVNEYYQKQSIKTDSWMWTASDDLVLDYLQRPRPEKTVDFIGLFNIGGMYRKRLTYHLDRSFKKNVFGKVGYGIDELYDAYSSSKFTLGTTSGCPGWGCVGRTMKGFRDWIGPACGSVLIYDDHPDVIRKYPCPTYPYDDYAKIPEIVAGIDYEKVLLEQQDWIKNNTLEKQFMRLFHKYGLVKRGTN